MRPNSEETQTNDAKVSDSGYSNSCSNSQSQRSSGSSKSRHSSSSGGSSGYCGGSLSNINEVGGSSTIGKRKEKEHKKKKVKSVQSSTTTPPTAQGDSLADGNNNSQAHNPSNLQQPLSSAPEDTSVRTAATDNEALQIAALSQTLSCIKKLKYKDKSDDGMDIGSPPKSPEETHNQEQIMNCLKSDTTLEEGMKIVVSMGDGVVVYTTPSLTQVLGFPKDMWIGRSFIDFVHPKHRTAFAAHITSVIADLDQSLPGGIANTKKNSFFCCLRQYRGLRSSGFNVTEKRVPYIPCQLFMALKEVVETMPQGIYLVITATPVRPAYKYPDETRMSPKFMTRHSASCQLCHVDPEATPYFGYLPQDLLGRSVLEFYHPEDLHFLKEVYEAVMKEQGHPFRSKPYRFRCQNGGYALLETEMSSYINPWSRKLEFIIGQHSVLRGPPNPDVMTPLNEPEPLQISEETLKESKIVQEEIKCLLNETVIRSSETAKQQVSKRCKDLATFMENLMDELTKPPDLKIDVPTEEQSFSERDSVMLGEISPHHEYYDSKSSSETPPSYNQLNYNENIQRFFDSKPKTTLSDSDESKNNLGAEEGKMSPPVDSSNTSNRPCCFANDSGGSGDSSGQSTESNGNNSGETTTSNDSQTSAKLPTLTEQILSRHNEDMEKKMVQKHKEWRSKNDRDSKSKERYKTGFEKVQDEVTTTHGVKRSGSHSWEGEPYKAIKATHGGGPEESPSLSAPPQSISAPAVHQETSLNPPSPPNLWPPFSVGVSSLHTSRPEYSGAPFASPLMPMYYLNPRPEGGNHYQHPAYLTQQLPFVPGMIYQPVAMPMFGASPMVYSPLTMLHHTPNVYSQSSGPPPTDNPNSNTQSSSSNQGISLKIESSVDRCLFVNMKGDKLKGQTSIAQGEVMKSDGDSNETSINYDDSSYHSSFYSFLKTDKSDESMKSSSENEIKNENNWRTKRVINSKTRPIRKVAPWVEDISVTPEFILKYQLRERVLEDVLRADYEVLEKINQPSLVNDQLSQMYTDLELEGLSKQLTLEEGITSSSESSGEEKGTSNSSQNSECKARRKKRYMEYDKMVILFEEDAPFPPPVPA